MNNSVCIVKHELGKFLNQVVIDPLKEKWKLSYGGGVAARQGYSTACLSRLDYWLGFWQLTTACPSQLVCFPTSNL